MKIKFKKNISYNKNSIHMLWTTRQTTMIFAVAFNSCSTEGSLALPNAKNWPHQRPDELHEPCANQFQK